MKIQATRKLGVYEVEEFDERAEMLDPYVFNLFVESLDENEIIGANPDPNEIKLINYYIRRNV